MTCSLTVRVVPKSGKQVCVRDRAGNIKVYLKSLPEGGAANYELIEFIAGLLRLPRRDVVILTGATARTKRLLIATAMTLEEVYAQLGIGVQQTIDSI